MIEQQNRYWLKDDVDVIDSSSDEELIQAVRNDKTMFVHLYRRYVKDVYRYAYSRLNHQREAEDITSQTFLIAMESFDRYRGDGHFGAYLIGIARRLIARLFRHKENEWVDDIDHMAATKTLSDEQITQKITLDQVVTELTSIPDSRAEAIRLHYFAGLQMSEVARVMRRSEMAIRMLVHRGIVDLKKRMMKETESQGENNEKANE